MRSTLRHPWPARPDGRPLCIAHRGASAHAKEGTRDAFVFAADLGSDMWEVDIWLTADGRPVVSHDPIVTAVDGRSVRIANLTLSALAENCPDLPTLAQIVRLAGERDQALYLDLKARGAGPPSVAVLESDGFEPAALGAFDDAEARALVEGGCPWPVTVLVRLGEDPFLRADATGADIIHLCWEHGGDRPQDLVTPELIAEAQRRSLGIAIWHEERAEVLADLVKLPVLGICTDNPERLGGFHVLPERRIEVVCHRGINHIAPENTMAAARLTYDMGCDWLELDVRQTRDGEIVVIHDASVDRTSDGTGAVANMTFAEIRALDAGTWKAPHWVGERVPSLGEAIALCQSLGRKMYIENKSVPAAALLDFVRERGFLQDCFFWSPDAELLREMRRLEPAANIKSNIEHHDGFEDMCSSLSPQICEIQVDTWEVQAPLCRAHGIRPMLQYFGDDPAVFRRIAQWQPEMINLDRADLLLAALKARA
ncbi:glycerophosphodiester phosphodiesterase family protein [Pseudoruegeria sp. HB172150]|uniref:glycerophosphodiester phosphodiesterase n=1 Tax=Pseudoruegeria sp. HB172150 TaxID=2721164 RepID=UPI001554BED1|nr:glycerophosphodiester phosphodiesterase family protein [Pseudoruegeria sp. HB172150]